MKFSGVAKAAARTAAVVLLMSSATSATAGQSPDVVGAMETYVTRYEDSLPRLAREHGLGYVELMAANPGTDPWLPGAGVTVNLPTMHVLPDAPRKGIVINLGDMRIYQFGKDGSFKGTWPIGVGREGYNTPKGQTKIVRKKKDPAWYPTENTRRDDPTLPKMVPAGPENPLGHRALYLGWPAYVMHGTNKPLGIGRRVSRGCIRLYPEHIEEVFDRVPVGTRVTVVEQLAKVGWRDGDLYLEVHPSRQQSDDIEAKGSFTPEPIADLRDRIWRAVGATNGAAVDWPAVEQAVAERRGLPVTITRRQRASNPQPPS